MKRSVPVVVAGVVLAVGLAGAGSVAAGVWRDDAPRPAKDRALSAHRDRPSQSAPSPSPSPSPSPTTTAVVERALGGILDDELTGTSASLSLAIRDNRTGTTLTYQPRIRYQTASTVKVDILATLLYQAKRQGRELSGYEKQLAQLMITESDNGAAQELWEDIGADPALTAANRVFGLRHTTAGTGGLWGTTLTTATDQLRLLDTVLDPDGPLGAARSAYLRGLMSRVDRGQSWGVSAAAYAGGEKTILKNGWDIYRDGWNINSIGRISGPHTRLTVAIYSTGSRSMPAGIKLVQNAAMAARAQLEMLS